MNERERQLHAINKAIGLLTEVKELDLEEDLFDLRDYVALNELIKTLEKRKFEFVYKGFCRLYKTLNEILEETPEDEAPFVAVPVYQVETGEILGYVKDYLKD